MVSAHASTPTSAAVAEKNRFGGRSALHQAGCVCGQLLGHRWRRQQPLLGRGQKQQGLLMTWAVPNTTYKPFPASCLLQTRLCRALNASPGNSGLGLSYMSFGKVVSSWWLPQLEVLQLLAVNVCCLHSGQLPRGQSWSPRNCFYEENRSCCLFADTLFTSPASRTAHSRCRAYRPAGSGSRRAPRSLPGRFPARHPCQEAVGAAPCPGGTAHSANFGCEEEPRGSPALWCRSTWMFTAHGTQTLNYGTYFIKNMLHMCLLKLHIAHLQS